MKKLILLILVSFLMISCGEKEPDLTNCEDLSGTLQDNTVLDGCYNITSQLWIAKDKLLTIKEGSTLIFNSGVRLRVSGSLKAVGTKENPITFTGKEKTKGYWDRIYFDSSNTTKNELSNVIIEYTEVGIQSHYSRLKIKDSLIENCKTYGFTEEYPTPGSLDEFKHVTITKCNIPVSITAQHLGTIDNSSNLTGNEKDYVEISNGKIEGEDVIWNKLTVPVFIKRQIYIDTMLEIKLGSTFLMEGADGSFRIEGALKAIGTKEEPITFKGLESTRGYWNHLEFNSDSVKNELAFVTLTDGGGVFGDDQKGIINLHYARLKLNNCSIKNSETWGVYINNESVLEASNNIIEDNTLGNTYNPE